LTERARAFKPEKGRTWGRKKGGSESGGICLSEERDPVIGVKVFARRWRKGGTTAGKRKKRREASSQGCKDVGGKKLQYENLRLEGRRLSPSGGGQGGRGFATSNGGTLN